MKHLKLLLLISIFLLCGCSSGEETSGVNGDITPTLMVQSTAEPTEVPVVESTSSDSLAEDEHIQEIISKAEELATSSEKITEGPLYDSISGVYSDVSITDMGTALSVSIKLSHETVESDTINFFSIIASIIEQCSIENYCSGISFSMVIDGSSICTLTLTNYTSSSNFFSSNPVVFSEEYKNIILETYLSLFGSSDAVGNFDSQLDSLHKKYLISD